LSGIVEVDETFIGGEEPGPAGGRAKGKKVLTGIAVEVHEPKGIGCGVGRCEDRSQPGLRRPLTRTPRQEDSVGMPGIRTARSGLPVAGSALDHGRADGVQVRHLEKAIKLDPPDGDLAGTHLEIIVLRERFEDLGIARSVESARATPLAAADHGCTHLDAESSIGALRCRDHILGLEHGIGE
jgi:hypothetical protein